MKRTRKAFYNATVLLASVGVVLGSWDWSSTHINPLSVAFFLALLMLLLIPALRRYVPRLRFAARQGWRAWHAYNSPSKWDFDLIRI